jgi:hypothetical protein
MLSHTRGWTMEPLSPTLNLCVVNGLTKYLMTLLGLRISILGYVTGWM